MTNWVSFNSVNYLYNRNPVACGIASLGFDHTAVLGNTIEKIASHKAGIIKVCNTPYF